MSVPVPIALVAALIAFVPPAAALPQGGGMNFAALVVRAADANRDGRVERAEWEAFTAGTVEGSKVDALILEARVFAFVLDSDGDGRATLNELAADLEAHSGTSAPVRRPSRTLGLDLVVEAGDSNGDGQLSADERVALLADTGVEGTDTVPEASLAAWVRKVATAGKGDRSAMTPSVVLLSMESALDATRDGKLAPDDLARLFASLDANADGVVDAGELRPSAGTRRAGADETPRASFEEQRRKPPVMPWQRNLEDALALSKLRGQPLLICVNMDDETASESLAWYRYRDPEFAALASGFVPLIVSPDVHAPRTHDDRGRRRPDPRFGRVIESEHIDVEPLVFERFFDGRRVAPRHVGVAPDGRVLFDLFLLGDLGEIDAALRTHGVAAPAAPPVQGTEALLASHDAADREQLEARMVAGEEPERFDLASEALSTKRGVQHPELVRLALRDPSLRVRRQALWTAARELAVLDPQLWEDALRVSAPEVPLRGVLLASFARLARSQADAPTLRRAETIVATYTGLSTPSAVVDVPRWLAALVSASSQVDLAPSADELDALSAEVAELEQAVAAAPADAELRTRYSERLLRLARALLASGQDPSFALSDARDAALAAEAAGARDGRAAGVAAAASWLLDDQDSVARHAARALPLLSADPATPIAAAVLAAFARSRTTAIYEDMRAARTPKVADIADANAAWRVLLAHPAGTAEDAVAHVTFLAALGARAEEAEALRRSIVRHPDSAELHAWMRAQVLRDDGAEALEALYQYLAPPQAEEASWLWFAGVASLSAAEAQVGNGAPDAALAAYGRAVQQLRSSFELAPDFTDTAQHYVALALAGVARLHADAARFQEAASAVRSALAARPASANSKDGLGYSPTDTANVVLRAFDAAGRTDAAQVLRKALTELGVESTPRPTRE